MSKLPAAAAVIAATVFAVPGSAQQGVLLRFTPPVGQVTHYRNVNQTWMQIPGMSSGDTSVPTMTQTMYTTKTVTAASGSSRVVSTTVDSSARQMPGMEGMMPSGDMFRGMVTIQRIDPLGRVDSVSVTPPPGADPMVAEALQRGASSNRSSLPLPERALGVGDSWTDSLSLPLSAGMGGALTTFHLTYRLDRIERVGGARVAVISMTGAVGTVGAGAAGAATGTMSGQFRFDLDASRLISVTNDMTGEIQGPSGSMPMRSHTVTEVLP